MDEPVDSMVSTAGAPGGAGAARAWIAPAVAVAIGGFAAFALNLGIGRVVGVPEVGAGDPPLSVAAAEAGKGAASKGAEAAGGSEGAAERTPSDAAAALDRTPRLSESAYLDGILARNLFDPSQIGVKAPEEAGATGEQQTELKVTLMGTIVSQPAAYSAAFIVEEGQSSAWAYGIGQKVQGAEIVEILVDRVRLRRNGEDEWLSMGGKVEPERRGSAIQPRTPVEEGGEVEQVSDNEFVLERSMVEEQLNDLESLARMGRALLHRGPDGEYDGYRLSAIRRGSLPDQIGIRNGDIIHSINGIEMNSLEGAMEAYEKLRNESKLDVDVTRRGRTEKLSYSIR